MPVIETSDGHRLWYEAEGDPDAPAIVFPARFRAEFAALGTALAERYRVVRYKPRRVIGALEPEPEAGGEWAASEAWTAYPSEVETADLHAVADAAGAAGFVLAGYAGTAALAGFLVPLSDRVRGLLVGGFPLLSGLDYWLGFEEGARAALLQAGFPARAVDHHLGRLLFREWAARDDRPALSGLPGPKVLWFGARDGEPDCRMYDFVGGAAIARQVRERTEELRELGFTTIEVAGQDHIGALAETGTVAARLLAALDGATW